MKNEPYTYWTLEYYDAENGIRGGGGLGVLAADTRRIADQMGVPLTVLTPFYTRESHQVMRDGHVEDVRKDVDWRNYDYHLADTVYIKCCGNLCKLDIIEKDFGSTRILCVTEPNFGELYQGLSGSDHRLYQEVSLGFGGYMALKAAGRVPGVMQLNEVVTFFAALSRLDDLVSSGMDFYEAFVYSRRHTLYTNHTLVQAAEAEFSREQFERFVYPNLKSLAVRRWLDTQFVDNKLKLSLVMVELAGLRSGVSKLHTRVADYRNLAGERVEFQAITNGVDFKRWVLPEILTFYHKCGIIDSMGLPASDFGGRLELITSDAIRGLKRRGREVMNEILQSFPNQNGEVLEFKEQDFVFCFKRRFVDYKRPELVFRDLKRLRSILEPRGAHYILAGRIHTGDERMQNKLMDILKRVSEDDYLRNHVHYLTDYDERLAYGLSVGCNAAINVPIVGLEACGTSWEKDVANLQLLISTHDGGVADVKPGYCLGVSGKDEAEELESLYTQMEEAIKDWGNDFDLEFMIKKQLAGYLPVISGARMMKDYLDFLSLA